MAHTFEFAVLRLAPDATRGEAVNLGIVVFKDGEVDVRVGEVITRARLLFPEINATFLGEQVDLIKRLGRVSLSAKERHRALSSLGAFQLGELGHFTSSEEAVGGYEARVAALMQSFVAVSRRKGSTPRPSSLISQLRKEFRREKVLAVIGDATAIADHKIVPEWPIPNRPSLRANFALRNGMMRVCELVDLDLTGDGPPPSSFFSGVVTLDAARREAQAQETVFAYEARGRAARIDEALKIAEPHANRMVNWEKKAEREAFLHDWIGSAKGNQVPA